MIRWCIANIFEQSDEKEHSKEKEVTQRNALNTENVIQVYLFLRSRFRCISMDSRQNKTDILRIYLLLFNAILSWNPLKEVKNNTSTNFIIDVQIKCDVVTFVTDLPFWLDLINFLHDQQTKYRLCRCETDWIQAVFNKLKKRERKKNKTKTIMKQNFQYTNQC